jgi:hypothetical protein
MQTIDFIQTVKWIMAQFSEESKKILFSEEQSDGESETNKHHRSNADLLKTSHELPLVIEKFKSHPFAPAILGAFNLPFLLDSDFPVDFAAANLVESAIERSRVALPLNFLQQWKLMTDCIKPIEKLTIPSEVINEKDFDEILTIELRREHDSSPKAETISEVLLNTVNLYATIARAHQMREFQPLTVIYADSGSSFRFDFKGLGEPIKELKELFIEMWNKYRHRKADDFEHNSNAFLSGLKVAKAIESYRQEGLITAEDANRYARQIMESGIALFDAGVLPREIPRIEVVSNQELLSGIQRKLLPPATNEDSNAGSKKTSSKRRKTKSSRRAKK